MKKRTLLKMAAAAAMIAAAVYAVKKHNEKCADERSDDDWFEAPDYCDGQDPCACCDGYMEDCPECDEFDRCGCGEDPDRTREDDPLELNDDWGLDDLVFDSAPNEPAEDDGDRKTVCRDPERQYHDLTEREDDEQYNATLYGPPLPGKYREDDFT